MVINNSTVAAIKKTFLVHGATRPSVSGYSTPWPTQTRNENKRKFKEEETPNPAAEVNH
ncbi:hypothetical protein HK096_001815, partial [Nowakowskiella sp. JEL0078]